jgi:hypothetical protein
MSKRELDPMRNTILAARMVSESDCYRALVGIPLASGGSNRV